MSRRIAFVSLLLFALLAALLLLASQRRSLAEASILSWLRSLGVEEPKLRVSRLDLHGAELRDLLLGRDAELGVKRIEVSYSVSGLRAGRLDSLRASGLRLRLSVDEAGLSFGSLDAALGSEAEAQPASPGLPALPFEEAILEDVRITVRTPAGKIEARGAAACQGGQIGGNLGLALRDWNIESPVARLEGVNAAMHLDGSWPPSLAPGQLLSMARLDFGLELTNGLVRFGLRPDGTLDLERAEWEFAGGRVSTSGSLDLAAEEGSLVLQTADVDLAQLLALVPLEGLSGEGRLGGRLPILRHGEVLEIRQGLLSGAAGGGWIRYRPPTKAAGLAAGQYGLGVLLSALENFRYESLELSLDGKTRGVVQIGLHLRGANPGYQGGRTVELNLNLESELVDLLRQEAASYRVPELIEKRLAEITIGVE